MTRSILVYTQLVFHLALWQNIWLIFTDDWAIRMRCWCWLWCWWSVCDRWWQRIWSAYKNIGKYIVSKKKSSRTYMCKIGIILQCYLKYDGIIGHFDIGIIFSYIGISQRPLYMLLSNEIPHRTQSLIGCSTLSQEYCKLIGWYSKIMRHKLYTLTYPTGYAFL